MNDELQTDMGTTVAKGITGVVTPLCGLVVSALPSVEAWLRITSLAIGIAVGVATLISILKKKR